MFQDAYILDVPQDMIYIPLVIWTNLPSIPLRGRLIKNKISLCDEHRKTASYPLLTAGESIAASLITGRQRAFVSKMYEIISDIWKILKPINMQHTAAFRLMAVACQSEWSSEIWERGAERTYWGVSVTHPHVHAHTHTEDRSLIGEHLSRITMRDSNVILGLSQTTP